MNYKKIYAILLTEVDKALTMMEQQDNFRAYQTLLKGCELCEEEYITQGEDSLISQEVLLRLLGYCTANGDAEAYKALRKEFAHILEE